MVRTGPPPFGRKDADLSAEPQIEAVSPSQRERAAELIIQGNALEDSGKLELALALYQEASQQAPEFSRAYVNIGNALQLMGRLDEAIAAQETALKLAPESPAPYYNLGALLAGKDNVTDAERALREALRLNPDMTDAAIVLADVLEKAGRLREAEIEYRQALARRPDSSAAAHNFALFLLKQERVDDAEDAILRTRSLRPDIAQLGADLGSIYVKTGRARDAERFFREALATQDPPFEAVGGYLFSLNLRDDQDTESVFLEHRRLGAAIEASASANAPAFANPPLSDRPLKIGYVSGDFREHPVGLFIRPVLQEHDPRRFETHCYANHRGDDDLSRVLKSAAAHWHPIADLSDAVVADAIRNDGIDVLVDLSGYTAASRLPIFLRRPAPVQVTWLGYLNTTGLRAIDYRLCDHHTDPSPGAEILHTEQLVRFPHSQWCYAPVYSIAATAQPHPEHPDVLVFGSFNQFSKISDNCLTLWSSILRRLPSTELHVYGVPEGRTRSAFIERVTRHGVDPARVSLRGRVGIVEYFRAIGNVDIALDTHPYNGATTTLDALWMGVPIVALRGSRAIARGSYSINSSLGVIELLATTPDEYIEKNIHLAQDAASRNNLRRSLRRRLEMSPLMDPRSFVGALETRFREMWRAWCEGRI